MSWLTPDLLGSLTAPGLLLLTVLLFMLGWIVPRSSVREARADRDQWREAHRLSESAREINAAALREALEVARAAEDALKGFREATGWVRSEREGNSG